MISEFTDTTENLQHKKVDLGLKTQKAPKRISSPDNWRRITISQSDHSSTLHKLK